jgi:hypothetical protein
METTTYKSKIGLELAIPVSLVLGGVLVATLINRPAWPAFLIIIPIFSFIWYLFLTTKYSISDNKLTIKCGFLFHQKIEISTITKIIETNNPLSSPAASLDRLDIRFKKSGSVLISPKEKLALINHLLSINPAIEVKYKKK